MELTNGTERNEGRKEKKSFMFSKSRETAWVSTQEPEEALRLIPEEEIRGKHVNERRKERSCKGGGGKKTITSPPFKYYPPEDGEKGETKNGVEMDNGEKKYEREIVN